MVKGVPRKTPRNREIVPGIRRLSRTVADRKKRTYLHSKKGDTRTAAQKEAALAKKKSASSANRPNINTSRFYAADDIKIPLRSRRTRTQTPHTLRKSLTAGTVVIILAGRFRGKRVIYLKQLESGLLLVTGPYKINGVPLRRVNAAYVIATSTHINISKVDISKIDDNFFDKPEKKHTKTKEGKFIAEKKEKTPISAERKQTQSKIDGALKSIIAATPNLDNYLNAKFSLTHGQKPHLMTF